MSARELEALLRKAMGLAFESIGGGSVDRAVQERERACGLQGAEYLERVRGCAAELQALVEALVVPETWFFRDAEAFAALADVLRAPALVASALRPLRLLSAPCSTGEEPYSMAMVLLESGLSAESFCIDAVDISAHALGRAELGVYGRNSFRGGSLAFRERYFEETADGYRLADAVRKTVRLRQVNLAEPALLGEGVRYDAIFCRNLLIYFDRELQERTVRALCALLGERGWLFAAAAEAGLWQRAGLMPARSGHSLAFCRPTAAAPARPAPTAAAAPAAVASASAPARPRAAAAREQAKAARARPRAAPPAPPREESGADAAGSALDAAQRLADQGRLAAASALLEQELRERGPHSQVYYLLGLARDAEGERAQAAELYRKALYLEPAHGEALSHLACLLEEQGDEAGARRLRERAARAERRGGGGGE